MNLKKSLRYFAIFLLLVAPTFLGANIFLQNYWPTQQGSMPEVKVSCVNSDTPGPMVEVIGAKTSIKTDIEVYNVFTNENVTGMNQTKLTPIYLSAQPVSPGIYLVYANEIVGGNMYQPVLGRLLFFKFFTVPECKGG